MATRLDPNAELPEQHVVEALIADGPVTSVYRVRARDGSVRVARLLPIERVAQLGRWFREGAELRQRLVHPGLPRTFLVDVLDSGEPIEISDFLTGRNVRQALQRSPRGLLFTEVERITASAAEVLDFLHRQNPVRAHRALSPERVFLRARDNGVRVLDLGVADRPSPPAAVPLAAAQRPPSGVSAAQQDHFLLASLVFEMLTGKSPFREAVGASGVTQPPSAQALRAEVPPPVDALLAAQWRCDPDAPPQTAQQFADRLRKLLSGTDAPERADEKPTREVSIPSVSTRKPTLIGTGRAPLAVAFAAPRGAREGAPPGTRPGPLQRLRAPTPPTAAAAEANEPPARDDPTDPGVVSPPDPPTPIEGLQLQSLAAVEATTESPAGVWQSLDDAGRTQPMPGPPAPPPAIAPTPPAPEPESAPPEPESAPAEAESAPAVAPAQPEAPAPIVRPEMREPSPFETPAMRLAEAPPEAPEAPPPAAQPIRLSPEVLRAPEHAPFAPATATPTPRQAPAESPVSPDFLDATEVEYPNHRRRAREVTQLLPSLAAETPWHRTGGFLGGLCVAVALLIVGLAHAVSYGTAVKVAAAHAARPSCEPCPVCPPTHAQPAPPRGPAVTADAPSPPAPAALEAPRPPSGRPLAAPTAPPNAGVGVALQAAPAPAPAAPRASGRRRPRQGIIATMPNF